MVDSAKAMSLFSHVSGTYYQFTSVDDVEKLSDVIAIGEIVDCQSGPTIGNPSDGVDDISTVVYTLKPERVLKGKAKDDHGKLYFGTIGNNANGECRKALGPDSIRVLAYLTEHKAGNGTAEMPINRLEAGRPAGQPLFGITHPQGFAVVSSREGKQGLVLPFDESFIEADLTQMLPGGDALSRPRTQLS